MTSPDQHNADTFHAVQLAPRTDDVPLIEEAIAAAGMTCSSYRDAEKRTASVRVPCESQEHARETVEKLGHVLREWSELLNGPLPPAKCVEIKTEDWATSWQKYFHAFRASQRLLVKPSWENVHTNPGDIVLDIDPGMCFGTGYHGTTRACLQFLDELAVELGPVSFLDAGCGSGILTLAAHQLGYGPICAFDHDPQAVRTAYENVVRTGITSVRPIAADVSEFAPHDTFRVVAVNILAEVLQRHADTIARWVDRNTGPSYLLLSGILTEQYERVRNLYAEHGLEEIRILTIDEWTSGCFRTAGSTTL